MGNSKRRKQLDPNYGKPEPLQPELINYCNSTIAGESAFVVMDFWTDAGGVIIAPIEIDSLSTNQSTAYQIARQPTCLDLGIRRQHEQSLGCLGMMDRDFRRAIGLNDFKSTDLFIFNWFSTAEIERSLRQFGRNGKGKAAVFAIVDQLIATCDPKYQFPCWFSGIPADKNSPNVYTDLIFICDRRNPSHLKMNTAISSENYL